MKPAISWLAVRLLDKLAVLQCSLHLPVPKVHRLIFPNYLCFSFLDPTFICSSLLALLIHWPRSILFSSVRRIPYNYPLWYPVYFPVSWELFVSLVIQNFPFYSCFANLYFPFSFFQIEYPLKNSIQFANNSSREVPLVWIIDLF